MSLWSITGFKVKFCKMDVKNMNISIRARPSPAQTRFPTSERKKKRWRWSILLVTDFSHSSMKVQTSQNAQAALQYFGEAWIKLGTKGLEQWERSVCEDSLKALLAHVLLLFDAEFERQLAWLSPTSYTSCRRHWRSFCVAKKRSQLELKCRD